MSEQTISLNDRYDLDKPQVLLNGTQALVRLMLMQKARDRHQGLNTAGLVTGYRGSPLGAVDLQMARAQKLLSAQDVKFQYGLNEDLAVTALWGAQQAEMRGEGKYDGVFGLWYGKGPGVDRSGDALRHANMAGSSQYGGVLVAMGDDHTGESSSVLHQSEWSLLDCYLPIVSPAGVQEILDYGVYGYALSRFSGLWVGLKTMKDTIEVTSVVDGDPNRMKLITPQFDMPPDGVNIRLDDDRFRQEDRIIGYKRFAAEAFSHANKMDKRKWGKPGAKIGLVAAGKNWLDLTHALTLLNIDETMAERLGITTYKVGQTWPMDMKGFHDWAEGLDLIIVVEEKRKLIEIQIKEAIFDDRRGRRVYGWYKGGAGTMHREELFPTRFALDPIMIAEKLGGILIEEGRDTEAIQAGLATLAEARRADNAEEITTRLPYFCSGCPHNSSTKVPEGSRAYAGIGCHFMVQWMDRETQGYTHMGAEGVNWVGEAPFSKREHIFQNIGDGTYNHSGILAIRAALAEGTNMTYKILYNDAVAMTGGQEAEGGLTAYRVADELRAMGVEHLAVVYDAKEDIDPAQFPAGTRLHERAEMMRVQSEFAALPGVSVILYVQTCAAEKRRRRKKGTFPDPDQRVFINTDICEGCGDCGIQSNCVSIVPAETELGRKRAIDQSTCNKDFSCVDGFCPSFVMVKGAQIRKAATAELDLPDLPDPVLPQISGTHNVVITGVGGTGVVTIGAVLAQAAQIDGKGVGMMEMAGLAQKGGAVHIHCRLANTPDDISAIRVATGEADALIGGDLIVSAGSKTLGLTAAGRTGAVVNSHEIMTGDFTRDTGFKIPGDRLQLALQARLQDRVDQFDATELARITMGDTIYSNMIIFGAAWQRGLLPVTLQALIAAITLNGTAVERNKRAFAIGRWAVLHPKDVAALINPKGDTPKTLAETIQFRADHLQQYQSARLSKRYRRLVDSIDAPDLREAVAKGYHKLLSYKDEYEVARLLLETKGKAEREFDGALELQYQLAPPFLGGKTPDGRPRKRAFGSRIDPVLRLLTRFKRLRGTPLDVFGYSPERKMERALIRQYERDMQQWLGLAPAMAGEPREALLALALLPLQIRGFGPVKAANEAQAAKDRENLILTIKHGETLLAHAAE